jgi:hypothetical protein
LGMDGGSKQMRTGSGSALEPIEEDFSLALPVGESGVRSASPVSAHACLRRAIGAEAQDSGLVASPRRIAGTFG